MIYYAKANGNTSNQQIERFFEEFGIKKELVVIDHDHNQKQQGSKYYNIKENLLVTRDIFVIDTLTSIGKNNREIYKELSWFVKNGIQLKVLDIPTTIRTSDSSFSNQIMMEIFSVLSKREINNSKEKQKIAIAIAKKNGKELGRKRIQYPDNWDKLYSRWKASEITAKTFIELSGLKKGTFYNLLKKYELEINQKEDAKHA